MAITKIVITPKTFVAEEKYSSEEMERFAQEVQRQLDAIGTKLNECIDKINSL